MSWVKDCVSPNYIGESIFYFGNTNSANMSWYFNPINFWHLYKKIQVYQLSHFTFSLSRFSSLVCSLFLSSVHSFSRRPRLSHPLPKFVGSDDTNRPLLHFPSLSSPTPNRHCSFSKLLSFYFLFFFAGFAFWVCLFGFYFVFYLAWGVVGTGEEEQELSKNLFFFPFLFWVSTSSFRSEIKREKTKNMDLCNSV